MPGFGKSGIARICALMSIAPWSDCPLSILPVFPPVGGAADQPARGRPVSRSGTVGYARRRRNLPGVRRGGGACLAVAAGWAICLVMSFMSSRAAFALALGLLGFLLYVGVVVALADHVLRLHWAVQALYFLAA